MKIESLKDLEAIIKLCRKTGVASIEVNGIKLELGAEAPKRLKSERSSDPITTQEYTPEQLLMWSSAGIDG